MSGTHAGGLNAAQTNKMRYGDDFYKRIGTMGGASPTGAFKTVPGLARRAGKLGGHSSKRGPAQPKLTNQEFEQVETFFVGDDEIDVPTIDISSPSVWDRIKGRK